MEGGEAEAEERETSSLPCWVLTGSWARGPAVPGPSLVVFSCPAPMATTQSGLKKNKPSVGQCKPSPVRGRMCGCSSFPHPPSLQGNVVQQHQSVFAGVSPLGHMAKGCGGARGMATLQELPTAPGRILSHQGTAQEVALPLYGWGPALQLRLTPKSSLNEDL